jgi:hypothetical protein
MFPRVLGTPSVPIRIVYGVVVYNLLRVCFVQVFTSVGYLISIFASHVRTLSIYKINC